MQKFTVIGINKIEFKNKKTKEMQDAILIYTTYVFRKEDNADGVGCEAFFCTGDLFFDAENVTVGDEITVNYSKTGYLTSIQIV